MLTYSAEFSLLLSVISTQLMHLSHLGTSLKILLQQTFGFVFTTIHEQPFHLPPYYKLSDLITFTSVAHNQFLCSRSIDVCP